MRHAITTQDTGEARLDRSRRHPTGIEAAKTVTLALEAAALAELSGQCHDRCGEGAFADRLVEQVCHVLLNV